MIFFKLVISMIFKYELDYSIAVPQMGSAEILQIWHSVNLAHEFIDRMRDKKTAKTGGSQK
jgi:hypothetical protein